MKKLAARNFKINTAKCSFFEKKVKLFGIDIENGKASPSASNIKAIQELKVPSTVKGIRSILGCFTYFRYYIPDCTNIAMPIQNLLKGRTNSRDKLIWGPEQEEAFNKLKQIITSKPVIQIYDPDRETFLHVDASSHAIGAMLSQRDPEDGNIKPVSFYSEPMKQSKRHKSSYDLELIALSKSLLHYRKYLYLKHFTVLTDHKNLTRANLTASKTINSSRIKRITDTLNQFDFDIRHIPGKENIIPDILSRQTENTDNDADENCNFTQADHSTSFDEKPYIEN